MQTIYSATLASKPALLYRRERWETPDKDFIDLDWMDGDPAGPLFVLFHGLEGSSNSHYSRSLMAAVRARGQTGLVVHFRSCSGEMNRLPRGYHSGDSVEIDWIVRRLKASRSESRVFVSGVSLGGNALLKWLGEQGDSARGLVHGAAAISAPMDLRASGLALGRGFNRVYTRMFLNTMKKKSRHKLFHFPELFDGAAMHRSRNLYEFDNAVTAPLHGFRDVDDYWARASSKPVLRHISVPTLILNARNDPFIPDDSLPRESEVSSHVHLEYPATGGHVGFASGPFPGHLDWLPRRLMHHFETADKSARAMPLPSSTADAQPASRS